MIVLGRSQLYDSDSENYTTGLLLLQKSSLIQCQEWPNQGNKDRE